MKSTLPQVAHDLNKYSQRIKEIENLITERACIVKHHTTAYYCLLLKELVVCLNQSIKDLENIK